MSIRNMKRRSGFTLVELLIVIIIIGILAGGMMLVAGGGTDKANATKIVSDLRNLKSAALMYYADKSEWPSEMQPLQDGGYIDRDIKVEDYVYLSGVNVTTPGGAAATRDLVGYKGKLMESGGVTNKLKDTAEASGLFQANGKDKYAGDKEVYMLVR